MNVLIICVNFNSYEELSIYLKSVEDASACIVDRVEVDVIVADNSFNSHQRIEVSSYQSINISVFPFKENLGYLGAITTLIGETGYNKIRKYDFVIFSNVDLILTETFFSNLYDLEVDRSVGWIAPQIFSLSEKRDRNPKILNRPSLRRIKMLILMFKYPVLYRIYNSFIYSFRNKKLKSVTNKFIYAGHGSFMIFTKSFMDRNVAFKFPSFLFGEEIFFGELIKSSGLKVIYAPEIKVNDIDHSSTSKLKRNEYCRMNYESLVKIIKYFGNE